MAQSPCTNRHLGNRPWHQRTPSVGVPRNHAHEYPTLRLVLCWLLYWTVPYLYLGGQVRLQFDITAYRTQDFSFQVSQLVMSLDDKFASFTNHGVVYPKGLPTNACRKMKNSCPPASFLCEGRLLRKINEKGHNWIDRCHVAIVTALDLASLGSGSCVTLKM